MNKTSTNPKRPEGCADEHLKFLDDLRESGVTNMLGGARYLDDEYPDLADGDVRSYRSSKKAGAILVYWMETFGNADR